MNDFKLLSDVLARAREIFGEHGERAPLYNRAALSRGIEQWQQQLKSGRVISVRITPTDIEVRELPNVNLPTL